MADPEIPLIHGLIRIPYRKVNNHLEIKIDKYTSKKQYYIDVNQIIWAGPGYRTHRPPYTIYRFEK
jgi:hypothetical protein